MRVSFIIIFIVALMLAGQAQAVVTRYTSKAAWQAAVGPHTTITFQGYEQYTPITDQYSSLGVLFSDGNDYIWTMPQFPNDGIGLTSNDIVYGIITMDYSDPITAVGIDLRGIVEIELYSEGMLIHQSAPFFNLQSIFGGLVSSDPFDRVVLRNVSSGVINIDDLYFGPPIPAPGALGLLGLAALARSRRRR